MKLKSQEQKEANIEASLKKFAEEEEGIIKIVKKAGKSGCQVEVHGSNACVKVMLAYLINSLLLDSNVSAAGIMSAIDAGFDSIKHERIKTKLEDTEE